MQEGAEGRVEGREELDSRVVAVNDVLTLSRLFSVLAEEVAALLKLIKRVQNTPCEILMKEVSRRLDREVLYLLLQLRKFLTNVGQLEDPGRRLGGICLLMRVAVLEGP